MASAENHTNGTCPIAASLELLGEKWTLLILRDLYLGHTKFNEIEHSLGCPRNLLSTRLRKLTEAGILTKEEYKEQGSRTRAAYALTPKGHDLAPILEALQNWGIKHVPGTQQNPPVPHPPAKG
ncbi:winged helix-turn-helix transcriptional regulator [Corynebacterium oculi]|uniref:Putative HTH-type transcriptional regulator YybR n=1 Tax=Corynebacterium oculi TaxID=1544416 RepID=A0A0Q1DV47_9CORY|nr:helix-turn-helix domain-containing protein [Corynebacterium oculi]KQB84029.1 putative HTH-type transcriptional regulator YybR [Corynebacterium oculi]